MDYKKFIIKWLDDLSPEYLELVYRVVRGAEILVEDCKMDYKKLLLNIVEQARTDTEESQERLEIAYYFTRRLLRGF